jgi:hypothetical protein
VPLAAGAHSRLGLHGPTERPAAKRSKTCARRIQPAAKWVERTMLSRSFFSLASEICRNPLNTVKWNYNPFLVAVMLRENTWPIILR